MPDRAAVKAYLLDLQSRIVAALEDFDGKPFQTDSWTRPAGGGGLTRLIEDGNFFERGGCNFSHVMGAGLPPSATAARPELAGRSYEAMGVSLVLHPRNPYCPTVHMNVRFFIASSEGKDDVWWFGGGMDLTPYYPIEEDVRHFHATCKAAVLPWGEAEYQRLKDWCDRHGDPLRPVVESGGGEPGHRPRGHRIGQSKNVFVYKLIAAGSIEEKILALQEKKAELEAGILGEDRESMAKFCEDEIRDLLAALPE